MYMGCRACGLNLVCPTSTLMVQDRTPCSADVVNYPITTLMLHTLIYSTLFVLLGKKLGLLVTFVQHMYHLPIHHSIIPNSGFSGDGKVDWGRGNGKWKFSKELCMHQHLNIYRLIQCKITVLLYICLAEQINCQYSHETSIGEIIWKPCLMRNS